MTKYVHTNIIANDWRLLADFYCNVFDCSIKPPARNQKGVWLEKGTGVNGAELHSFLISSWRFYRTIK
ncbi:MAG: hypothetical protein AAGK97_07280, partial [Bacteroidota bacterium]